MLNANQEFCFVLEGIHVFCIDVGSRVNPMHSNWISRATFDCEDDEGIYVFYTDMRIHVPPFWGGT